MILNVIKRFSIHRPLLDYSKVRLVYNKVIRGKGFQLRKKSLENKIYLNAGCGAVLNENFINLDYWWRPKLDLCWDVTRGLPFKDKTLLGIFMEHCLEHLTYSDAYKVLLEFLRVLKPGGNLMVIVPDAELYINIYQSIKMGEVADFPSWDHACKVTPEYMTPIMEVTRAISLDGEHRSAYDFKTLEIMLKRAGFADIKKASFKQGRDSMLLIDLEFRKPHSLYVEASAPS